MTAKEYLEIEKQKGNERVCKLIKFLQDNGYDYSEFDLGMIVNSQIKRGMNVNYGTSNHNNTA